ncbi:MAG: TVP38/TMEM64 family protein [Eubacteriales bacterium]
MKRITNNYILSLVIMFLLLLGLYIYKPISLREISTVEGFVDYSKSFGAVMPLTVLFITVFQAIIPVIPFVILCSANGVLFGFSNGILITWLGTLSGASITFFVSRKLGYEWAAKRYKRDSLKQIEQMHGFRGFLIILALRLLPYFPAPLINISAGVSRLNFLWFLLASALGKLPFIIGYTLLGYSLLHTKNYILGATIMAALILIPYLIMKKTKRTSVQGKEP